MNLEIIQINESNSNYLDCLDEDIFDQTIAPDLLAQYFKEANHIMVVARSDERVIGQVLGVIGRHPDKPTELYIDDMAVSEPFQRKGIATKMLKKVFAVGASIGCKEIWVATEPDNEAAKACYNSLNLSSRIALVFEGEL